ncbi:HAUS augmin-like complex subunit 1 [Fukomys damarensis]|uniref:HAUS augmin-like complex subunit 1 n=1 Tax=Fukomys damarensis TaxID=885580 RepID=A0A091DUW7_FUKDA|nr:HAUS augmin-like complex subunit 1 [Fukomys damarensis]
METRKEKEAQVFEWLKEIFGDHLIPHYEVNPWTTEILYHPEEHNRVWDRDACLVIEDYKQKVNECESEAKHLQDLLMETVKVSPANLSSTGSRYLNALVDSAMAFGTKDTSLAGFIPAVNDLTTNFFFFLNPRPTANLFYQTKNEEHPLQLGKLERNLTAPLVLEKCLREDLKKAECYLSARRAKVDHRLQNKVFLRAKAEEFRFGVRAAEEQPSARGRHGCFSVPSVTSSAVREAGRAKGQTVPLKENLETYLDVMPNPSLAQVKIEEARGELDTFETELKRRVDTTEP